MIYNKFFLFLFLVILIACKKPSCPPAISNPSVYLTESLDLTNCNCRIISATVVYNDNFTIEWYDDQGEIIPDSGGKIRVCPDIPREYTVVLKNEKKDIQASIVEGPPTSCDKKEITVCTKVLVETINDLIQLYHKPVIHASHQPLSNKSKYEGKCAGNDNNFGSAKLNAVYGPTSSANMLSNFYYKVTPLPLTCSYVNSVGAAYITAPISSEFVNGMPDYLISGEKIFANMITPVSWSDYLITITWTSAGSSHKNLGYCPPEKKFIIDTSEIQTSNEVYYMFFFNPKDGCSYIDAYNNHSCKEYILYKSIKRVFNPRIDGTFCDETSDQDFRAKNVKVTIELMDNTYMNAYIGVQSADGSGFFKYQQQNSSNTCP